MDRKTEYDLAKTVLMLERMGLDGAAKKLEEGTFSHTAYAAGEEAGKAGEAADPESHEPFEKDYMDGYRDGKGTPLDESSLEEAEADEEEEELEELNKGGHKGVNGPKHDCKKVHPKQSHDEYMASKNEAVKLKGMTKEALTETIKEMIRRRLNN